MESDMNLNSRIRRQEWGFIRGRRKKPSNWNYDVGLESSQ